MNFYKINFYLNIYIYSLFLYFVVDYFYILLFIFHMFSASILSPSHCTKIYIYPNHLNTWQNVTLCECEATKGSQFISICYMALSFQGVSCPRLIWGIKRTLTVPRPLARCTVIIIMSMTKLYS